MFFVCRALNKIKIKEICFVLEAIYKKLVPVHILTLHRQGWNHIVLFTVFRPPLKLTDTNTMALNLFIVFLGYLIVTDTNTNGDCFVKNFSPTADWVASVVFGDLVALVFLLKSECNTQQSVAHIMKLMYFLCNFDVFLPSCDAQYPSYPQYQSCNRFGLWIEV